MSGRGVSQSEISHTFKFNTKEEEDQAAIHINNKETNSELNDIGIMYCRLVVIESENHKLPLNHPWTKVPCI